MKQYTSDEILQAEDLYELQDTFSSSAIPFQYQMTKGEIEWANLLRHRYAINDWVLDNMDTNGVLTFNDPMDLKEALEADGMHPKAVMLSDETALQRLFFWLS